MSVLRKKIVSSTARSWICTGTDPDEIELLGLFPSLFRRYSLSRPTRLYAFLQKIVLSSESVFVSNNLLHKKLLSIASVS